MRIISNDPFSSLQGIAENEERYSRFPVIKRGKGPYLYDHDENRFVDFELRSGSLLLGHAPACITSTIKGWIGRGYTSGYPSASHRMASKSMLENLLVPAGYVSSGDEKFLYFDSIYAAASAILNTFKLTGIQGTGILFHGKGMEVPGYYCSFRAVTFEEMEGASIDDACCVVVRFNRSVSPDSIVKLAGHTARRGLPLIVDASDVASFLHICRLDALYELCDALLFGEWIAAGLPFGAVMLKGSLMQRLAHHKTMDPGRTLPSYIDALLKSDRFPPTYKLKAVQTCVLNLLKNGGMNALLQKHSWFYNVLDHHFFELDVGMVYLKNREGLQKDYDRFRLHLLKGGFYFPRSPLTNLAVSFAHSHELLEKCARKLNAQCGTFLP